MTIDSGFKAPAVSVPVQAALPGSAERTSAKLPLLGFYVLVVEDHDDSRDLVQFVLQSAGASVMGASCVQDAMLAIGRTRPDVVVSDIGMPGEDGYSLMHRLQRLPAVEGGEIPAIALSAFGQAEDRQAALDAGFQMHLAKPVRPDELIQAVARVLRLSRP